MRRSPLHVCVCVCVWHEREPRRITTHTDEILHWNQQQEAVCVFRLALSAGIGDHINF